MSPQRSFGAIPVGLGSNRTCDGAASDEIERNVRLYVSALSCRSSMRRRRGAASLKRPFVPRRSKIRERMSLMRTKRTFSALGLKC